MQQHLPQRTHEDARLSRPCYKIWSASPAGLQAIPAAEILQTEAMHAVAKAPETRRNRLMANFHRACGPRLPDGNPAINLAAARLSRSLVDQNDI